MLNIFDRLIWQPDRMLLDDLIFRLQHYKIEDWNGGEHFMFFKIKKLVDEYENYFRRHSDLCPKNVVELGMWDGGSVAFWHELLQPQKHVGLDFMDRSDSPYFRRYVESRGLSKRIRTFWNMNQADKPRLREIIAAEFDGPLDLVLDDASHLYGPTLASFETLFPLLTPGGLYIIEDWAWDHWPEFIAPDHPWVGETSPTPLVIQLIEAAGTSIQLIANVTVYEGFVSVERGPMNITDPAIFTLEDHIIRRPSRGLLDHRIIKGKVLRLAKKLRRAMPARLRG
jgi:cephalosporin hydroxylase